MCGIAGIVNFSGLASETETQLKSMCNALRHRGPDNEGFFHSNNIAFGQRRLSIIDLSSVADQPMVCEKGEVIVNFNGEIFNHAEIRKQLEHKYNFKTSHSDTEALLYAYKEWGIDCVKKFVGMFAIAIYDKRSECLYLVRDRIGQKPLYYLRQGDNIFFSSEINAFFEAGVLDKKIRKESIYHYLSLLTVNAPNTFFEGVNKLEAGCYIRFDKEGQKQSAYWNISDHLNRVVRTSEAESIGRTEFLLEESMRYRNISDAPVSLALSGGLDSSLNLHYSAQINNQISAINIDFEGEQNFNESSVAQAFCKELNIPLFKHTVTEQQFIDTIPLYLDIQRDQPLGDPNFVLMFMLSNLCRQNGSKVLLVGEGGDEIGGYPKYLTNSREYQKIAKLPRVAQRLIRSSNNFRVNKFDIFHEGSPISRAHVHGFTEAQKRGMWLGNPYNSYEILQSYMAEIDPKVDDNYLRSVLNLEYKLRLPELILARIDYPSMAASIEARSPFADHNLIEFSAGLPFDLKMKNGRAKHILKEIAKNKLPDYVLNHPKVGFGQLLSDFLNNKLPLWFENEVLKKESPLDAYLNKNELSKMFKFAVDNNRMKYQIWMLYALHKWLERA